MRPAAVLVVLVVAAGCNSAAPASASLYRGRPEKPSLQIGVAGQGQLLYLPLTLAAELGYFRAEGLEVKITDLKDGPQTVEALNDGTVDAVADLYEHALLSQVQHRQDEMIAVFDLAPGLVLLVNQKHGDAHTIQDIARLRIGVTAAGSPSEEMVKYLFKSAGLDPGGALLVPIGAGAPSMLALKNDQIQALATVEPVASMLEQSGDGRVLFDTRTLEGTRGVFGGTWPAGGLYLPGDFVQANPRTVGALTRALLRALRYLHQRTVSEVVAGLPQPVFYPDGNQELFTRVLSGSLGGYSLDGVMPEDGPGHVLGSLKAAYPGTDWSSVDLRRSFENAPIKAAAKL
ncbi:MAG TPA: ABC transporter substrate-binding protein [Candidatus Dormibacteraeota bacterium]